MRKRVRRAEKLLGNGWNQVRTQAALMKEFGVSNRTARRYIRAAKNVWRAESRSALADREKARAEIRGKLMHLYEVAINRVAYDKDGNAYDNPDISSAVRIMERLTALDGVDDPDPPAVAVQINAGPIPQRLPPPPTGAEGARLLAELAEEENQ